MSGPPGSVALHIAEQTKMTVKPLSCAPRSIVLVAACINLIVGCCVAHAATLGFGQPVQEENGLWRVPVLLRAEANENVASLQFRLGFEQRGFEVVDVATGVSAADAGKEAACTALRRDGARVIVAGMNLDRIEDGEVAQIRLRASTKSNDPGNLTLDAPVLCDPMGRDVKGSIANGKVTCSNPPEDSAPTTDTEGTPVPSTEGEEATEQPADPTDSTSPADSSVSEKAVTTPTTQQSSAPVAGPSVLPGTMGDSSTVGMTAKDKPTHTAASSAAEQKVSSRPSGRVSGGPLWTLGTSESVVKNSDKRNAFVHRLRQGKGGDGSLPTNQRQEGAAGSTKTADTQSAMQVAGIRPTAFGKTDATVNLSLNDTDMTVSAEVRNDDRWDMVRVTLVALAMFGIGLWVRRRLTRR